MFLILQAGTEKAAKSVAAADKPESSAEKDSMEVLKKEGNMRRESSVLVPSSFQIAIAAES